MFQEYLPTPEEKNVLSSYKGDLNSVGQAEKYMMEMMNFNDAASRINCMIYKKQFTGRVEEVTCMITKVSNAANDVRSSTRLKKVLKTILKVGNQMNDGEGNVGFTLDSLLKLQSAKAFDKKTSILQYVVTVVANNAEDCLLFPDDLSRISDASRITIESITAEQSELSRGLDHCRAVVEAVTAASSDNALLSASPEDTSGLNSMIAFVNQVRMCVVLDFMTD